MTKLRLAAGILVLAVGMTPVVLFAESDNSNDTYRQLDLFANVFERVRSEYVEDVSDQELIEAAINGMLTSLDPHSSYLNQDNFQDMQVQTRGTFGGLGIEVTMENGLVVVVSPIDDTPAFRAGLQAGDVISGLDGEPVLGLTLSDAVERMRGPVGTDITLTVLREDEDPFEVTITRDIIRIESVRHRIEDGGIGYIRVTSFTEQTEDGVEQAVEQIEAELGDDLVGFILDLRNNPGGLLDQAVAVADAFLEQGEIVSTRSRIEDNAQRYNSRPGDIADGRPLVVLINGGSASASEIVAGALQDHGRAVVLGTRSFGKGSVQTIVPLPGHGAMRLTTARYYTPAGRSIQALGIEPDIEVRPARVEEIEVAARREADLRGALGNDDGNRPMPRPGNVRETDENGGGGASTDTGNGEPPAGDDAAAGGAEELPFDYQLARAIDLLRGVALFNQRVVN